MDIQAIINKKLGPNYVPMPNTTTTIVTGDDPASQAVFFDTQGLPRSGR